MIPGAALLVLGGAGLFVTGLLTGVAAWYWACVATCAAAAVLILRARRAMRSAPAGADPAPGPASAASAVGEPAPGVGRDEPSDPPIEEVEVSDLLLVLDLTDEVLVVDERPRYHVAGCRWLDGRSTVPLPLDEARTDGFTPCGTCRPDRTLAGRARARRAHG